MDNRDNGYARGHRPAIVPPPDKTPLWSSLYLAGLVAALVAALWWLPE